MTSQCYYHDNIEKAMAESMRCGFPLIVLLHAKPDVPSLSSCSSPEENKITADDLSFVPSDYVAARYHVSSSLSASASDAATSSLVAPAPAFLRLTHATNNTNTASPAFQLNPDFPLGTVRGGVAQRIALEATLELSGLAATSVLLRLVEGEAAFEQFTTAMAAMPTGPAQQAPPLPRAYVFTPVTATLATTTAPGGAGARHLSSIPPLVLFGAHFTPKQLANVASVSLSFPPDPVLLVRQQKVAAAARGRDGAAAAATPAPLSTAPVSDEAPTGGQGFAFAWKTTFMADVEAVRQAGASSPHATTPSTGTTRTATAAASTPASIAAAKTLAETAALRQREMHVVHVIGLPFQRTKSIFVTTPSMTLKTVWQDVAFTLQRLQKELERCKELDEWEKFGCEKGSTAGSKINRVALLEEVENWFAYASTRTLTVSQRTFQLRLLPPAGADAKGLDQAHVSAGDADGRLVKTPEEAQRIHMANLPNGARIQVVFTDPYAAIWPPAGAQPVMTTNTTLSSGGTIECDGDVCRRVPAEATAAAPASTTPVSASSPSASASPSATTHNSTGSITLRCTLPSGEALTLAGLDPQTATLAGDVRPAVAARLGHDRFHFVQAYPLRRFSVDQDERSTLEDLDVRMSCAVRVVLDDDAPPQHMDTVNPFGRLRNLLASSGTPQAAQQQRQQQQQQSSSSASAQPPQRTFHSMREMLDAQEQEENSRASQEARMAGRGQVPSSDPQSGLSGEQDSQGILQRFAQRLRAQQQQQQQQPEGGDPSSEPAEAQRPGKSQRYNGSDGAGRRLGGNADGSA